MWILTLHYPSGDTHEYPLKEGISRLGRTLENDICVPDRSASRIHAEIENDLRAEQLILRDLDSTNGTYLNRQRIVEPRGVGSGDTICIGGHVIAVESRDPQAKLTHNTIAVGTRPVTYDAILESLGHYAKLMYQIAQQLNTVLDIETALREVSRLMKSTMGADKCNVILADRLDQLGEDGFPTTIAQEVIQKRTVVIIPEVSKTDSIFSKSAMLLRVRSLLCVPVLNGDNLLGLIYMYKTNPGSKPFNDADLNVAVAISNQAALTIQRAQLVKRVQNESKVHLLLQRFLSHAEAEYLLRDYLHTGSLPPLTERKLTVLFVDIVDSTSLAERLGPKRFGEILSRYYQEMTDIIFKFGGMLDKYMGDGLMAVFGMNPNQRDPEMQAVLAGLTMLEELQMKYRKTGECIEVGIGINTGNMVAGYIETVERIEFMVLGDVVNVAHHLETLAHPNRVIIGPMTAAAIAGHFLIRHLGAIEVKGRTQPVQAHNVMRLPNQ